MVIITLAREKMRLRKVRQVSQAHTANSSNARPRLMLLTLPQHPRGLCPTPLTTSQNEARSVMSKASHGMPGSASCREGTTKSEHLPPHLVPFPLLSVPPSLFVGRWEGRILLSKEQLYYFWHGNNHPLEIAISRTARFNQCYLSNSYNNLVT